MATAILATEPAPVSNPRYKVRPVGSTWGDWGPDDQIGRLNLVTPDKVKQGMAAVIDFKSICLSLPLDLPGGTMLPFRPPPSLYPTIVPGEKPGDGRPMFNADMGTTMGAGPHATDVICDDIVHLTMQYSTQWDSLAHVGSTFDLKADGKPVICYYNGYIGSEDMPMPAGRTGGAKKLGIQNIAEHPMQGRAVLFDLEKHFGLGCIAGMKEIKQIIEKDKIVIKSGDFAVFHTGAGKVLMDAQGDITPEKWKNVTECGLDGRDPELLQWVTDSGFVALISDNLGVEAYPNNKTPAAADSPHAELGIHEHCLFKLGCYLGELWYLAELADHLKANNRTAFFLTAPPLRLPGAVGSPANGVATV